MLSVISSFSLPLQVTSLACANTLFTPSLLNSSLPSNMPAAVGEIRMELANLPPEYNYMSEALPMPREGTPLQKEELDVLMRRRQVRHNR